MVYEDDRDTPCIELSVWDVPSETLVPSATLPPRDCVHDSPSEIVWLLELAIVLLLLNVSLIPNEVPRPSEFVCPSDRVAPRDPPTLSVCAWDVDSEFVVDLDLVWLFAATWETPTLVVRPIVSLTDSDTLAPALATTALTCALPLTPRE